MEEKDKSDVRESLKIHKSGLTGLNGGFRKLHKHSRGGYASTDGLTQTHRAEALRTTHSIVRDDSLSKIVL
jgi:hypothetical protein